MLKRSALTLATPLLRSRPDFLVIGTQKAGTTSLFRYLLAHPRIVGPSDRKELHFFTMNYGKGLDWYLSHFPPRHRMVGRLCFEATPDYLCHHDVAARIRHDLGRPKLVAVLRDPVQRAWSAWKMWSGFQDIPERRRKADGRTFAQAVADEMAAPDAASCAPYHYLAHGRYAENLLEWFRVFGREGVLVLEHAEMERDLHGFLGRICGYLDIEPLEKDVTDALATRRYWSSGSRKPTAEDEETFARLADYYAPHDRALADLLGRPPSWTASATRAPEPAAP